MVGIFQTDLTVDNCSKDLVNGLIIGDGVVEDKEVPLEPLRDVIPPAPGVDHGGQVAHVHQRHKVPGLLQAVETLVLDHGPDRGLFCNSLHIQGVHKKGPFSGCGSG